MKNINEKFEDEEFDRLKEAKGDISWHDFIMSLVWLEKKDGFKMEGV